MAHEIKLEVLTFGIRKLRDTDSFTKLDNLHESKEDFFDVFREFLTNIETDLQDDKGTSSAFRLMSDDFTPASVSRTYRGIFESGHYGVEGNLEHLDTKARTQKSVRHVDLIPFYFLIHIPKGVNKGVLMLQRFGQFGTTTIVKRKLSSFIEKRLDKSTIDFNPLVTKELANEFKDGRVKEIILTKYNLPSDIADKIGLGEYKKEMLSIEIRIKAKRQSFFKKAAINSFASDPGTKFLDARIIKPLGFDGQHKVKIKSKKSGIIRTVDLSNTGEIRPYYDIDQEVKKNTVGYPEFKSIDKIAMDFLAELK